MATTKQIAFSINAHMAGNFGATFGKVNRTLNAFQKSMHSATGAGKMFSSTSTGLLGKVAGLAAAYVGFSRVSDFLKESIDLAKAAQIHETNYQTLMAKAPNTTKAQIASLKEYATALSHVGIVSAGTTKEGFAQLATFRLSADNIKTLAPGLLDLAVRTHGLNVNQEQIQTTANQLGKVFMGQAGALRRVGISFDQAQEKVLKHGRTSEKVAMLAQVLAQNFGGVNRALALTQEGKLIQIEHRLKAMKKTIGEQLLPLQERWLNFIVRHIPEIEAGFKKVVAALERIIQVGGAVYQWMSDHWGLLKWAVYGVTAQVILLEGAIKTAMAVQGIKTAIDGFRTLTSTIWKAQAATDALAASEATLGKGGLLALLSRLGPYGLFAGAVVGGGMAMNYSENKYGVPPIQRYQKEQAEKQRKAAQWEANYRKTHKGKAPGMGDLLPGGVVKPFQPFPGPLQILQHAAGGIFSRPHLGIVGESGPEAVVPLARPARARQVLAAAGLGGVTITNNISITGGSDVAGQLARIAEETFAAAARRFQQQQRRVSYA